MIKIHFWILLAAVCQLIYIRIDKCLYQPSYA